MPVSKRERERDENQPLDKDPLFTNTTFLPCQGNCGKLSFVEIHSWSWNDNETKYIIKEDCYQHDNTHYTCAICYEKKKPNQNQIQQLKAEIQQLENITNRTRQQEQELQDKKARLSELERKQQEPNKTNYLPWILGIGGIFLVGIIAYFLLRKKEK